MERGDILVPDHRLRNESEVELCIVGNQQNLAVSAAQIFEALNQVFLFLPMHQVKVCDPGDLRYFLRDAVLPAETDEEVFVSALIAIADNRSELDDLVFFRIESRRLSIEVNDAAVLVFNHCFLALLFLKSRSR